MNLGNLGISYILIHYLTSLYFIDVDCGTPESIDNGKFNLVSNVTYYGSAVLYECDDHFQLDGHGRRLCLENGTWSSETPKCQGTIKKN